MTHIVFGIDDKYLPPMLVSLYTALKNANGNVRITVFTVGQIDQSKLSRLVDCFPNATLNIREFKTEVLQEYENTEAAKRFPLASMIPLFVPWLIDSGCIFLDADTLVLQDVSQLYETQMNSSFIAATMTFRDRKYLHTKPTIESVVKHRSFMRRKKNALDHALILGFTPDEFVNEYFSSGVILFDVSSIKAHDPSMKHLERVYKNKEFWSHLPDQDILNVYYRNRVFYLDFKWNVYRDILMKRAYLSSKLNSELRSATRNPAILHYNRIYDRQCWEKQWFIFRPDKIRYRIYRQTCVELEKDTGINVIQMFRDRV